jgi:two-component system NtrC family sensor kinase
VDYIISDIRELINESLEGANRVRRIVQDLKSFSRVDLAERSRVNDIIRKHNA